MAVFSGVAGDDLGKYKPGGLEAQGGRGEAPKGADTAHKGHERSPRSKERPAANRDGFGADRGVGGGGHVTKHRSSPLHWSSPQSDLPMGGGDADKERVARGGGEEEVGVVGWELEPLAVEGRRSPWRGGKVPDNPAEREARMV